MITLKPSKVVQKQYDDVDFVALSLAFTSALAMIYGRDFRATIHIRKSKTWDYYKFGFNEISVCFDANQGGDQLIKTIIHELRHWQQDKIFKISLTGEMYNCATYSKYYNSLVEVDARHFQKVETEVIKIYRLLISLSEKNTQHKFEKMYRRDEINGTSH